MPSASASAEFGRHAQRAQHVDDEAVAHPHPIGQLVALLGQKHPAIGPRRRQAGALEARNGLDGGGVRHAEPAGDVGGPRLAFAFEQIRDQLGIILKKRSRLRRPRLAEPARLGAFGGKFAHVRLGPDFVQALWPR